MTNVVKLVTPEGVEKGFISLLDSRCNKEGAVKPLSSSLFNRIEQLKAKADAAQQRHDSILLEG